MFDRKAYMKQWHKDNPEYAKQWRKDNSKNIKKCRAKWVEDNYEKIIKDSKMWRVDNPEKVKNQRRRQREKKRKFIQDYKFSKGCSVCGYNKCVAALEFHHNGEKEFAIGLAAGKHVSMERLKEEIENCIVLCANCHRELHFKKMK